MSGMAENRCDGCDRALTKQEGALCDRCIDEAWDRFLDRHDDIGPEE